MEENTLIKTLLAKWRTWLPPLAVAVIVSAALFFLLRGTSGVSLHYRLL